MQTSRNAYTLIYHPHKLRLAVQIMVPNDRPTLIGPNVKVMECRSLVGLGWLA